MNGFTAFLRKEFTEQLRTYKLLIMLIVFTIFGMMSPLLAKLMPEIFASLGTEGLTINFPEPTYMDAYAQLFKNVTQMGVIVLLLVFAGSMSQELSRGTLVNVLAKGLPRIAVVLSKFVACLTLWAISLDAVPPPSTTATRCTCSAAIPRTHLLLLAACACGCSARSCWPLSCSPARCLKGGYGGLLATVAVLGILLLLSMLPGSMHWNPVTLVSVSTGLMDGTVPEDSGHDGFACWISAGATVLSLAGCGARLPQEAAVTRLT